MPSRRDLLRGAGGLAVLGVAAVSLSRGVVRTRIGIGGSWSIDLEEPDDETFVPPDRFGPYRDELREQYGTDAIPWTAPSTLDGDFLGAFRREEPIVPDNRYAVQTATLLVHELGDGDYRLRLWSAGRLLDRRYPVDPWGLYTETPAFTRFEQGIEADIGATVTTDSVLTRGGGPLTLGGGTVTVPEGTLRTRSDDGYRTRWEGFHAGVVPIVGACRVRFEAESPRRLRWQLSNGVGVRTPV